MVHVDSARFCVEDFGGKTLGFVIGSAWIGGIVNLDDAAYQIV
jgi:hypothetical protein